MHLADRMLKTQQLAEALGVGVSTIKRWVDDEHLPAIRTEGGHRLIRLRDALQYARRMGYPLSRLEALVASGAAGSRDRVDGAGPDVLLEALRAGEAGRTRAILHAAHAAAGSAAVLGDEMIRPVMGQLGHDWLAGSLDVYQEHHATHLVAGTVVELIERAARLVPPAAPLAIGASPEGDQSTLSVLLGELTLREAGWDVRNLGSNLPLRSLDLALRNHRPRLVFLSVNHLDDRPRFVAAYRAFHRSAEEAGAAVMLGGRALDAELRADLPYHSFGERLAHLGEFARLLAQHVVPPGGSGCHVQSGVDEMEQTDPTTEERRHA